MENKDQYMRHLQDAPPYRSIASKIDSIVKYGIRQLDKDDKVVTHNVDINKHDYDGITYHFASANTHICPTIIIDWTDAMKMKKQQLVSLVLHLIEVIANEVNKRQWQVLNGEYIVKGCNSTRGNVMIKFNKNQPEEAIRGMTNVVTKGMKLVSELSSSHVIE